MVVKNNLTIMCSNKICDKVPHKNNIEGLCWHCNQYKKKCLICSIIHYRQGKTCSQKCTNVLKTQTYLKTCGAHHNFSGKSKSRKVWEERMLKNEGITNVFQRDEVKEKSKETLIDRLGVDNPSKSVEVKKKKKETLFKNYGISNIFELPGIREKIKDTLLEKYGVDCIFRLSDIQDNIKTTNIKKYGFPYVSQVPEFIKQRKISTRQTFEKLGIWVPLDRLNERDLYYYQVNQFTKENLRQYANLKFGMEWNIKNNWKDKTIDHKYSRHRGFLDNIPPEIIGSIVNLDILTLSENSKKKTKCSISKDDLYAQFNILKNENKIDKENKIG